MKIGLNVTCFNDRPSGAKQRFVGIFGELIKRLPRAEFIIYEPVDCPVGSWFNGAPNVRSERTPLPSENRIERFLRGYPYWTSALRRQEHHIFEGFNLPAVKSPKGVTLMTIHDIRGLQPTCGTLEHYTFRLTLKKSIRNVDHIVTVSDAMRQELLNLYPGLSISVIYNGVESSQFECISEADLQRVRSKFHLPRECILAVGHLERRKNYLRLIEAIAQLNARGKACALVIVGNDSGLRRAIEKQVAQRDLSTCVQILSGLTDEELRCMYKLCSLMVFPSSYEGFGIPILEAMAAGCPMVLSDIPVFREITQNQGVYFRPDDVEAMTAAIKRTLSDSDERARLVQYGNARVEDFRFQSLAQQLESVYASLV